MTSALSWLQLALFVGALVLITKPLGLYLLQVMDPKGRTWFDPLLRPAERLTYRSCRIDAEREQSWSEYAAARLCFPAQSRGSLVYGADGVTVRGSRLLAQEFTSASYFHPRPSAAGTGYDATSSGGTNYGPTSAKLAQEMTDLIAAYRKTEGLAADAVTRSGSGLDPEISVINARLQTPRVARNRRLSLVQVTQIIEAAAPPRDLGALGEPGMNVLAANLALDQLQPVPHP